MRFFYLLLIAAAPGLHSCMKPGAAKSGKKYYETFFVGEQGTQYFIKPVSFASSTGGALKMDITFRYKNKVQDSATINLGIYDKVPYKNLDSVFIETKEQKIKLSSISLLFIDKPDEVVSRYTAKCTTADLQKLFTNPDWKISVFASKQNTYTPKGSTTKKLEKINENVFVLF